VFFILKPSILISALYGISNTLLVVSHVPNAMAWDFPMFKTPPVAFSYCLSDGHNLLGCGHQDGDVILIRYHRRLNLLPVDKDAVELFRPMDQGI
jgi:hypothetical protein